MALETSRAGVTTFLEGAKELARRGMTLASRATMLAAPLADRLRPVWHWIAASRIARFLTGSLLRRIIASNLLGFVILLIGLMYLTYKNSWLIDAKLESLKAQSEIIAQAIAADAKVEDGRIVLDPDKLPEIEGALIPYRDDAFAALELSIKPEVVTPVLRRVMQQTTNRARIYDREGRLIVDTATMLSRGQVIRRETAPQNPGARPKTRNLWTKLSEFLRGNELRVFREIEDASGVFNPMVRDAFEGKTSPLLLLTDSGELIVAVAAPIRRAKAVHGALMLSTRPGEIDEIVGREQQAILTLSLMALAATLAASALLAQTVAGPMRRLSAAAEHASHDIKAARELPDFSERKDEVGQISIAVQNLASSLYGRIEASEKFAADVAHELKNPLTAARSTAEALGYARTEEQRSQLIVQIQAELKRLNRLITDVANASRLDAELALQHMSPVDITGLLDGVVATFRDLLSDGLKRITLEIAPLPEPGAYVVNGSDARLARVITNLIDNAISFSPDDGEIRVRARRVGPTVELSVSDDGPGIDEDNLEKVFERFYTYRPSHESSRGTNSGLGLSISREIVRAHRGRIWAENRYSEGSGRDRRRIGVKLIVALPAAHGTRRG
jgi:two-component system sensor histidine kinase ChvG